MTVYAHNDPDTGNANAHDILGEAMRVLHDYSPIPRAPEPDLRDAREQLQIAPHKTRHRRAQSHLDDVLQAVPSLGALPGVDCVQLDMLPRPQSLCRNGFALSVSRGHASRQTAHRRRHDPAAGPAGTSVTFTGRHLAGRPSL